MENLIDAQHGVPTLLATIAIALCLHLLFRLGEFVWEVLKKKNEISEQTIKELKEALETASQKLSDNTYAVQRLEQRLDKIEVVNSAMPKMHSDLRKAFLAIKIMAGDDWGNIRELIKEESKTQ